MILRYTTIYQPAQAETIEKKSRFIGSVLPIQTEDEALEFIERKKKTHWDASCNAYAYRINPAQARERASDDGEPNGTAGVPILEILRKEDIVNAVVVVTRYFGGTLLGAGGLIRAYAASCKSAVLSAGVVDMVYFTEFSLCVDYGISGKVQYEMLQHDFTIRDTEYTDNVTFNILVEYPRTGEFQTLIRDITSDQAKAITIAEMYIPVMNGKPL